MGSDGGVEAAGRTVEEAVQAALAQLQAHADDSVVVVLEQPGRGWLGLGGRPARVRVRRLSKGEAAERFVGRVGELVGASLAVVVTGPGADAEGTWAVAVDSEDAARWIGRHGQTLEALEHLCEAAAFRASGDRRRLSLDVGGYRERRRQALEGIAKRAALQVRRLGREIALEPMSASERRIVHLAVQTVAGVRTESAGSEPNRRVVIMPDR